MSNVEVILKEHVEGLGAEADVVKVKAGYARNFLIPQNIAAVADSASKRQIEQLKAKRAEREAAELNAAQELSSALKKVTLTFQLESAADQKVFGSVTNSDIAARLESMGHVVDRHKIDLATPLKALGDHDVKIHAGAGITATIKVTLAAAAADKDDKKDSKKAK